MRKAAAGGLACAIAAAGGLVGLTQAASAGSGSANAAATKKAKNITCNLVLFATIPQPAATAANFGSAKCGKPLGKGVQQDSSKVTRTSATTGVFTGPFQIFFEQGSIKGTFKIAFVTTLTPAPGTPTGYAISNVDYKGTLKVTSGTGKFKKAKGTGTILGQSPDAKKSSLQEKLKLTGV